MAVRFGTDGVRGVANVAITSELALAIGRAAARHFAAESVVIGRDTRRSGPMLAAATAAGVCAEGADAVDLGVVPTPAVALSSARRSVPGIVISASHNPFADNGLKVFAPGGRKLDDEEQRAVEAIVDEVLADAPRGPVGAGVGDVHHDGAALDAYVDAVRASLQGRDLAGMSVVVDCANGADHEAAPRLLAQLGASVTVIGASPDGLNINDGCGSTDPAALRDEVLRLGAEVGLAFDGDADRVLAVDHRGELVDGDRIIALCALDLRSRSLLRHDTVVVTVMSNLGFTNAMGDAGIRVVETPVGDRHVLEALAAGGYSLGGEQSGHIVLSDMSTTGDGLLAGVTLLDLVRRRARPLAELADEVMTSVPQILRNVELTSPLPDVVERLGSTVDEAREALGSAGRVLVRPSGTEPLVRVMVESTDADLAAAIVGRLEAAVRELQA